MTEEDLSMSEGISLEEQLSSMYHRYITPSERRGMEPEDIIENMRSAIEKYKPIKNLTDKQILDAANSFTKRFREYLF